MSRPIPVEPLEPRRLFALSLAALGQPIPLLDDLATNAAVTASPIGDDDVFVAYTKNSTLFGRILDPTGATLVPDFPISSSAQLVGSGAMDAVRDSSGNAVIAYPVQSGLETDLYVARVTPAGAVITGPTIVHATTTGNQSQPALAAGPNGQIGIAYLSAPMLGGFGTTVQVRAFNASNGPLFAEQPVNTFGGLAFELLANPDLFFNPATAEYLATWRSQEYIGGTVPGPQTLRLQTFQPDGDFGTGPHTLATDPDDVLNRPLLFLDPATGTPLAAVGQNVMNAAAYQRTEINLFTLSPAGIATPAPFAFPDAAAPDEFFPYSVVATANNTLTFFSRAVIHGASTATITAVTTDAAGNVIGTTQSVLPTGINLDPIIIPTSPGSFLAINPVQFTVTIPFPFPTTIPGLIDVSAQVLTMGGLPVDDRPTASLTATNVSRSRGGAKPNSIVVTANLSHAATENVLIDIRPRADLSTTQDYIPLTVTIIIPKGQLSGTAEIGVLRYGPNANDGTVTLESDSISGTRPLVDHLFTATITTQSNTNTVKTTAKPGKPATVADPDGTLAKISTSAGQIDISTDANGNLVFKSSKTNGQTKITILPLSGGTGDDRFNIQNFISQTPILSLNAPTTDIAGNLQLSGVTTLTTGDIPDNHTITLGPVKDAVLKFGSVVDAKLTAKGAIKSLSVTEWRSGSITATSIAKLTSAGDFDADLTVISLGTLTVTGALGGATASDPAKLRATQSLGTITAGSIRNALLLAGAKPNTKTLPKNRSAFNNLKATLTSLTLKGASPTFSNTIIAAPLIGTLKLAGLTPTNPTPQGITAIAIKSYSRPPLTAKDITKPKVIETLDQFTARTV